MQGSVLDDSRVSIPFFFSSRRRHTRCSRDWSSDVCSSDLQLERVIDDALDTRTREDGGLHGHLAFEPRMDTAADAGVFAFGVLADDDEIEWKIGRASCRERV